MSAEMPKFTALSSFRVEKNVPLPQGRGFAKPCPYPFASMDVGDSFVVAVPKDGDVKKLRLSIGTYARRHADNECASFTIATRVVDDGKAVRCWRVQYQPRQRKAKVPKFADKIAPGARVHLLKDDDGERRGPGRPRKIEGRAYK